MIVRPEEFDASLLRDVPLQKRKGRPGARAKDKEQHRYKDVICAFDIETSKVRLRGELVAFMYVWQFQFGPGLTIIGRRWEEFVDLTKRLAGSLEDHERLVVYVHNLSYEWSFIRDERVLGPYVNEESVFCIRARKIVKLLCWDDRIEFRCSYIHSNMGLDQFTKKMQVKHLKLSGDEYDYSKLRYPWTDLTERELEYCSNDVIGLVEAIQKECEVDHDDLYSIPLTSTGYVRRDIRKALERKSDWIQRLVPSLDTYQMLREAFRGGDTHASRFYAGKILPGPIRSVDRSSSYPDVQCNLRFPVSEFYNPPPEDAHSEKAMCAKIRKDRAVIARIALHNVKLRSQYNPDPYLADDKCRNVYNAAYDNGRILSAAYLETTITDVDLEIILHDYEFSQMDVIKWQYARYGPLPEEMVTTVIEYYVRKTELKNVPGEEILYEKSKNKLNGIFGCSSQDPVRMTIQYRAGDYIEGAMIDGEFHEGTLEEFMPILLDQSKPVMPYQWGVWTTAHARRELRELIWTCGDQFIYCDTDSVYFWGDINFEDYNRRHRDASIKHHAAAADPTGELHYMGIVEEDRKKGPYQEFLTLGAKKYAYRDKAGELHITISGVVKDEGAKELERAGGLAALAPGFVFRDAGGVDVIYQDDPVGTVEIDGHELYIGTGAVLVDSTYSVSLSPTYRDLLEDLAENDLIDIFRRVIEGKRVDN